MNLGGPELLLIVLVGLVPLALTIWGVVDAASRPDQAWQRSGQSKVLWVVLQVVGLFVCLGWILSIVYLAAIRPQVSRYQ
jgi:uncharacterized membrane protein